MFWRMEIVMCWSFIIQTDHLIESPKSDLVVVDWMSSSYKLFLQFLEILGLRIMRKKR